MSELYRLDDIDSDHEITTDDYYNIYRQNRELKDKINSLSIELEIYKNKYNETHVKEYEEIKLEINRCMQYIKSKEDFINKIILRKMEPEYGPLYYIVNMSIVIGATALAGSFYIDLIRYFSFRG